MQFKNHTSDEEGYITNNHTDHIWSTFCIHFSFWFYILFQATTINVSDKSSDDEDALLKIPSNFKPRKILFWVSFFWY